MSVTYWAELHSHGDGQSGDVGRLVYRGAFNSGGHYYPGDVVTLSGVTYVALAQRVSAGPAPGTDASVWGTVADVLGTMPLPAPPTAAPLVPGSSRLYGPYVVDYTDIPHNGDTKTLWVPQVGDVLLRLIVDIRNVTQWDRGYLRIAQNVTTSDNVLVESEHGQIGHVGGTSLDLMDAMDANNSSIVYAELGWITSAFIFPTADPLQVMLSNTGVSPPDPTQGHVELYALVARALAP